MFFYCFKIKQRTDYKILSLTSHHHSTFTSGRPTLDGRTKLLPMNYLSSSIHRAQQPRAVDDVFRRFGSRKNFNNWYKDLAHLSPNFHRGSTKCEIWPSFQHHSTLSRPRLKMQQDIRTLKHAAMIALCPRQVR